jgi:hypothetical protein
MLLRGTRHGKARDRGPRSRSGQAPPRQHPPARPIRPGSSARVRRWPCLGPCRVGCDRRGGDPKQHRAVEEASTTRAPSSFPSSDRDQDGSPTIARHGTALARSLLEAALQRRSGTSCSGTRAGSPRERPRAGATAANESSAIESVDLTRPQGALTSLGAPTSAPKNRPDDVPRRHTPGSTHDPAPDDGVRFNESPRRRSAGPMPAGPEGRMASATTTS